MVDREIATKLEEWLKSQDDRIIKVVSGDHFDGEEIYIEAKTTDVPNEIFCYRQILREGLLACLSTWSDILDWFRTEFEQAIDDKLEQH